MSEATASERVVLSGQGRGCTTTSIGGMTCGSCANAVHRALARVPGVVSVEVDLGVGRAMVQGDARPEDLLAAVEGAGYRAALGQGGAAGNGPKAGGCGCGC
ncbi:heavy-metal-associated domain-containing protein [Roseicella aerolata]|uniref:Heavy-metal-associated domain-containing protein n=1 Tax=Roseicella aerolata TaxID=2883479 RepID=A0A9X1IHQ3_9PROT|nr:heavy metal-associated domain-containing protein [Roseicella aerolata]MCB4824869.1 heavy-metal-associated domain-containing protein [Roseicella aerolata]